MIYKNSNRTYKINYMSMKKLQILMSIILKIILISFNSNKMKSYNLIFAEICLFINNRDI